MLNDTLIPHYIKSEDERKVQHWLEQVKVNGAKFAEVNEHVQNMDRATRAHDVSTSNNEAQAAADILKDIHLSQDYAPDATNDIAGNTSQYPNQKGRSLIKGGVYFPAGSVPIGDFPAPLPSLPYMRPSYETPIGPGVMDPGNNYQIPDNTLYRGPDGSLWINGHPWVAPGGSLSPG